jgi:hypothetical protein
MAWDNPRSCAALAAAECHMSKKGKPIRAKLIANPGAGNVLMAASRFEQVTSYLKTVE